MELSWQVTQQAAHRLHLSWRWAIASQPASQPDMAGKGANSTLSSQLVTMCTAVKQSNHGPSADQRCTKDQKDAHQKHVL